MAGVITVWLVSTVLIVDGTLVPMRDRTVAEQSTNYRYSTNHQVVIDAETQLVVAVGRPLPGNRNDCRAWAPALTTLGQLIIAGQSLDRVLRARHR